MTTDQTTTTSEPDDDAFPPVRFHLRNMTGEAGEIELLVHTLGLDRYLLVTPDEHALKIEASHLGMDELAEVLTFLLATTLQADQVSDSVRQVAREFVEYAVAPPGTEELSRVLDDIRVERDRQIGKGWTPEHDDEHDTADLVALATERLYLSDGEDQLTRRRLVEGVAMLVSAIEAIDRAPGQDTHPRATAALRALLERGEEPVHASAEVTIDHGHGGLCCCLMGGCRSDVCNVNAEIVRQLLIDGE